MKMKNFGLKQGGFTLIELLVVIVIIGILATIGIASFSGYFAKARDAERATNIRSVDTILKTAFAVEAITDYSALTTKALVDAELTDNGGFLLATDTTANIDYRYVYDETDPTQFGIFVCGEENFGTDIFVGGTSEVVTAIRAEVANLCNTTYSEATLIAGDLAATVNLD